MLRWRPLFQNRHTGMCDGCVFAQHSIDPVGLQTDINVRLAIAPWLMVLHCKPPHLCAATVHQAVYRTTMYTTNNRFVYSHCTPGILHRSPTTVLYAATVHRSFHCTYSVHKIVVLCAATVHQTFYCTAVYTTNVLCADLYAWTVHYSLCCTQC